MAAKKEGKYVNPKELEEVKTMYYFIYCDDDGEVAVSEYNRENLLQALVDQDYGEIEFLKGMSLGNYPQYWGNKVLIIKGEIVVPKPKKTVKEFEEVKI